MIGINGPIVAMNLVHSTARPEIATKIGRYFGKYDELTSSSLGNVKSLVLRSSE